MLAARTSAAAPAVVQMQRQQQRLLSGRAASTSSPARSAGAAAAAAAAAAQRRRHRRCAASSNGASAPTATDPAVAAALSRPATPSPPRHPGPLPEVTGPRSAVVRRATKETAVEVRLDVDGTGRCTADTPVGFLNHMLEQVASHGLFDVHVRADGDTWIDDHHTVEDVALALGGALSQALGDRAGIHRFGEFSAPLDEALTHVVLDLSGRAHLSYDLRIPAQRVGNFDTELVEHFFSSFAATSGTTLHVRQLAGKNSHHIIEATFKAFARALRRACEADARRAGTVASSKGVLTQQ
jgi:imidazoleglycerol-phosphate dehydratase